MEKKKDSLEKDKLAIAKAQYRADMKELFGDGWRKLSRKLSIHNPTKDPTILKMIKDAKVD